MCAAERLDFADKVIHSPLMRRICPSRQVMSDGFVRRLRLEALAWDNSAMASAEIDIDRIRAVLSEATAAGARFSQRSLSKAAGESRDCVGDLINGRNKNPTIKVLTNLAAALDSDLSIFGIMQDDQAATVTEADLEIALRDMLPGMPRGSLDKRARYLAEAVGRALKLPPGPPLLPHGSESGLAEDAPLLAPTN